MFCPKCGKEIPDNSTFCPDCGSKIKSDAVVTTANAAPSDSKSSVVAGLLGIFLGVYGVHNFYLGYTGKAVAQLILGVLLVTCPISAIWGLIEGIMLLTGAINVDGKGRPLVKN